MAGTFIPFMLDFSKFSKTEQAQAILDEATNAVAAGQPGAAIVYSANYGQTQTIRADYAKKQWITGISGINQAEVIMEMEALLNDDAHQAQQGQLLIAPISTMSYPDKVDPLATVKDDLRQIKQLLDDGWRVLGWQNQQSILTDRPYAVGGGVAGRLPDDISNAIQTTLAGFARDYPAPTAKEAAEA
ncbi:MAG: hypothetical protein WAS73_11760 [Defluviicoccus sp.]